MAKWNRAAVAHSAACAVGHGRNRRGFGFRGEEPAEGERGVRDRRHLGRSAVLSGTADGMLLATFAGRRHDRGESCRAGF